jgi:alginate O-acetyltransferase complex protein AlgI
MASLGYFILLALLLPLTALAGRRAALVVLAASLGFAWVEAGPWVLAAMLAAAVLSWRLGAAISQEASEGRQLRLLWAGVLLDLAPLIGFKYLALWGALGISYFSFQAIAYLCDIYFRTARPEPDLVQHLLSLFFFPKFIQGPIERPHRLQDQWAGLGHPDYESLRLGAVLIVWGLFKKLVVAERLGLMVDGVYGSVGQHSPAELLMATYAFAAQLFCDFSGYTDLALGSALLLGIRLTQNFDGPFVAASMTDFWRRWHISLSTWIRDYVFEPLQMQFRQAGVWGAATALFIAFFAMGVWHGATWGYAVFGVIHGALMAGQLLWGALYKALRKRFGLPKGLVPDWLGWLLTVHLVVFSFIFFRALSLGDAWAVLRAIPGGYGAWWRGGWSAWWALAALGQGLEVAGVAWAGVALVSAGYLIRKRWAWSDLAWPGRWALYSILVAVTLIGAHYYAVKQFIYAQF